MFQQQNFSHLYCEQNYTEYIINHLPICYLLFYLSIYLSIITFSLSIHLLIEFPADSITQLLGMYTYLGEQWAVMA